MALIGGQVMQEPANDSAARLAEARERFAQGVDYASVLRGYKGAAMVDDRRVVLPHSPVRGPFFAGYMAKDGPVFIGATTTPMRALARQALSIPDDGSDEPGFDPVGPNAQPIIAKTRQAVVDAVRSRTVDEVVSELLAVGVPVAPVYLASEVGNDPQASEFMVEIEDELTGPQRQLGGIVEMSKSTVGPAGPAPVLGRHTDEILQAEGLSADEIAELRRVGAVA